MTATSLPSAHYDLQSGRAAPARSSGTTPLERGAVALTLLVFSMLFVAAQFLHPDPFAGAEPMDGAAYLAAFHGHPQIHLGHLFEFFCGALLIVIVADFYGRTRQRFPAWAMAGLIMAATGAIMLVANKAAICLTASAFDTLPEAELAALVPGLDVIIHRQGNMAILSLLPLLPVGFVLLGALLLLGRLIPRWQAACIVVGSLLLCNPGIQVMNTCGAVMLAVGFVPLGLGMMRSTP